MKFGYDSSILDLAPNLVAGVIWCKGVDNSQSVPAIEMGLIQAENTIKQRYPNPSDIARDPAIAAWRETYSALGLTPNRYPCAAESLIRRAVSGGTVPQISPLVDVCNTASLLHAIPVAPFDLYLAEGYIVVRRATGGEVFRAIGSETLEPIPSGEAVYADDTDEVLSRRWNWRQTGKGAIRIESTDILITTEAVHPDGRSTVEQVIDTVKAGIEEHLGGSPQVDILTSANPWSERTSTD